MIFSKNKKIFLLLLIGITAACFFLLRWTTLPTAHAQTIQACQGSYSSFRTNSINSCTYKGREYFFSSYDSSTQQVRLLSPDARSGDPGAGLILRSTGANGGISEFNPTTGEISTPGLGPGSVPSPSGETRRGNSGLGPNSGPDGSKGLCDGTPIVGSFSFGACLSGLVYIFTVGIATPFAYIAALFFEYTVSLSLTGLTYASPILANGWAVVRDVANMAFLFALIYIAFSLILNIQGFETKKFLTRVIVVALIVNFSFFISRIVIDAGNLLALTFYNQITVRAETSQNNTAGYSILGIELPKARSITNGIMQGLELQKVIGSESFDRFKEKSDFFTILLTLSFIFIAMGALLAILAYAFLSAGIKFIIRIVVLWITIILAPLGFVAWIFPFTQKYAEQWWDTHIRHALFPAAFLFIFFILAAFMQSSTGGTGGGLFNDTFNAIVANPTTGISGLATGIMIVAIRMAFVVALMLLALKAGDAFGVVGSNFATSTANWARGKTLGLYGKGLRRAGGWTYQKTAGYGAAGVDEKLKGTRFGNTWLGYRIRKNVTEPTAGVSLGGAQSRTAFLESKEKERKDRQAGYKDIENRDLLKRASDITAWGRMSVQEQAAAQARIKGFRKRELEALEANEVKGIAHLLSEDQIKDLQKSDNYTDQEKDTFKASWDNRGTYRERLPGQTENFGSPDAAINKADDIVKEIRRLNSTLRLRTASGRFNPSTPVSKASIADEVRDIETHADTIETRIEVQKSELARTIDPVDIRRIQGDIAGLHAEKRNSEKILEQLKKLEDERKKIPVNIGGSTATGPGTTNAGEFVARP